MKIFKKSLIILVLFFIVFSSLLANYSFAADTQAPNIYSPCALLMDLSTGKLLYEKDINKKMYPASLTKVLTCIIAIEECKLTDKAIVSYDAVMSLSSGYVTANLQIGEELSIEQLINVLMIASANDAAIVLAEHISGSVEEFSKLMNKKAKEIGCINSNFVTPNGAQDENHYSTAYDLALIGQYAMKNKTFRKIVSTTSYRLSATNKYSSDDRVFLNNNSLIIVNNNSREDNYYYKYATGIKTGFTTPAGNCLIASADKDGLELLSVVLGAGYTEDFLSQRYLDTISLFTYGYNTYTIRKVAKKGSAIQTISVSNATRDTKKLDVVLNKDVSVLIKKDNLYDVLLPKVQLQEKIKAPIKKGDILGTISYKVEGITYKYNLISSQDVKVSKFFINTIFIIFILIVLRLYIQKKKQYRKNRRIKKQFKFNFSKSNKPKMKLK